MAAFPIAAIIGAGLSLFGPKPKAPKNPYKDYMDRAIARSEGIANTTNLADLDQKALEAYVMQANRIGDRLVSAQNASDFASGGTPLADSERGVARGVISSKVGEAIGNKAAELESTRYQRQMDIWNQIFGMGVQGFGPQQQQNQSAAAAQSAQNNSIFQLANAFIGGRAQPTTPQGLPDPSWSGNNGGWAGYTGSAATTRNLQNNGIFL